MRLGMVGLGKMGANMTRRLMKGGHELVVTDLSADNVKKMAGEGAISSASLDDFVGKLGKPKIAWLMVPAGDITDHAVAIAGEAPISPSIFRDHAMESKLKGAPIDWVAMEAVPTNAGATSVGVSMSRS